MNWTQVGAIAGVVGVLVMLWQGRDNLWHSPARHSSPIGRESSQPLPTPSSPASPSLDGPAVRPFNPAVLDVSPRPDLRWPVEGTLLRPFPPRDDPARHRGVSILPTDNPLVYAPADGLVQSIIRVPVGTFDAAGWQIAIRHENRVVTLYQGLARVLVTAGSSIARGQVLGRVVSVGQELRPLVYSIKVADSWLDPSYVAREELEGVVPQCGVRGGFRLTPERRAQGVNLIVLDGTYRRDIFEAVASLLEDALCAAPQSARLFAWANKSRIRQSHFVWQGGPSRSIAEALGAHIPGQQLVYRYGEAPGGGYSWFGFNSDRELIIFVGDDWHMLFGGLARDPEAMLYGVTRREL